MKARGFILWVAVSLQWMCVATAKPRSEVVAYCAQDQVYAEKIFADFEKQTGIRVLAVYDSEAVKTVGLANRLLAEQRHPQCDVFWGNEEMRTRLLAAKGVFRETNGWAAFGYRSRRLVINTNKLKPELAPHDFMEITNARWRGKFVLAYPQFGTTGAHFNALRQAWGEESWKRWCTALAANKPLLVDGNSQVVKTVARGDAWVGFTDSDDIASAQEQGLPVVGLPLSEDALLIPNTVAVIRGAPHPEAGEQLFEYLRRPETAAHLVQEKALEGKSVAEARSPALKFDWEALLKNLDETTAELNRLFLR